LWGLVVSVVSQSACQIAALQALSNPDFNWIMADPASQKSNVTQICANGANNQHYTNFVNVLTGLETNCVPPTNGSTSPIGLAFAILKGVLCMQKEGNYCGLGLFALFDSQYFLVLQNAAQAGVAPGPPNLTNILTFADRKAAICFSDTCNQAVEQYATTYFPAAVANSNTNGLALTNGAIDFVTKLSNRMRCGCFNDQGNTCYTDATFNLYINASDPPILITGTACAADGSIKNCARTFSTCEAIPIPTCVAAQSCNNGYTVTVTFQIQNLDKTCFAGLGSSALQTLAQDLAVNLLGTKKNDFTLVCDPNANSAAYVTCTATIQCATEAMFDQNAILAKVEEYSKNLIVTSKHLDLTIPPSCKISTSFTTYGETTTFTFSVTGGVAPVSAAFSVIICLFALF